MMLPRRTLSGWQRHGLLLLLFLLLALWLTWPQAALLGEAVVGGDVARVDGWQKVWYLWWVRRAILTGQNPLYTDLLLWPLVLPLGLQPIDMSSALLTLPVLLLFGPLAAYGVAMILGFALSGWLGYLLALRVTGSQAGALLAGVIIAAAPQHLTRFLEGQLEHVSLQWVVLALLALVHATQQPTWRSGVWLALAIALVAYTSWYHALFLALLAATWMLWHLLSTRQLWPLLRPWLVTLPLLLLLISPLLPGLLSGVSSSARGAEHWRTQAAYYSADLLDLLLPSAHHPLWGQAVAAYQQPWHPNSSGWVMTPGYVALLLACCGLVCCWRAARLWGLMAGVLFLFALGTSLHVAGVDTGIPLPVAQVLAALPGTSFAFRRQIATLVGLVPLAVVAAYGVQALSIRLRGRRHWLLVAVLLGAALLEMAPPAMQVMRDDTAPVYATLRNRPGTLLVLPLRLRSFDVMGSSLRAQMTHERPIIGGYATRAPDYPVDRSAPLLRQFYYMDCEGDYLVPDDEQTARAALAFYDITQIVLHTERLNARRRACAQELLEGFLGLQPAQQSGPVIVYDVPSFAAQPFLFIDRGWHDIESASRRRWRWMAERGNFYLVNPASQAHTFVVDLRLESLQRPRTVAVSFAGQALGQMTVQPDQARIYRLLVRAAPGQHELRLEAATDEDPAANRRISIAIEDYRITQVR